jgi:putative two-component system response regulator
MLSLQENPGSGRLERASILVVDDSEPILDLLVDILSDKYDVRVATSGEAALLMLARSPVDLVLLDVVMSGMDGLEVCRRLHRGPLGETIPVIFLTALSDEATECAGLEAGAVDFIAKPINRDLVLARVANHVELKRHRDHLGALVLEKTRDLKRALVLMLETLGALAEYRDNETGAHIRRTQMFVRELAWALRRRGAYSEVLTDAYIDNLHMAAPLHDIGKVGTPDRLLHKPGRLTQEEYGEMKRHAEYGYQVLERARKELGDAPLLSMASAIAYTHHERWDGTGYPRGLRGEEIPLSGRIMALADVYDAMTTRRVYKSAYAHDQVVAQIFAARGGHFDPDVVDAFLEVADRFHEIAEQFQDTDSRARIKSLDERIDPAD